jgi:predicted MFS family arabinose efflux permease
VHPFPLLMVGAGSALGMTAPLELLYARRFGAGALGLAAFVAVPAVGVLIVDVLGTRFVPRHDARSVLAIGIFVFGISEVVMGASPNLFPLMVGRVLQGLGAGLLLGGALQAAFRSDSNRARALGSFNGAFLLGEALGAPAGGFIASLAPGTAGFRLAFAACAACSVVVALAIRAALPSLPAEGDAGDAEIGFPSLAGPPGIGSAMALGMLGDLLRGGVVYTALPLIGQTRHLSTVTIGIAIGLVSAVEIVVQRTAGRPLNRFGLAPCLIVTLCLGVGTSTMLAVFSGKLAFLTGAMVFGVVVAGATLVPALLIVSLKDDDPSGGLASYRMASSLGMLVGSAGAATAIVAIGASGVFLALAGLLSGGVVLAHRVGLRLRRPPAT